MIARFLNGPADGDIREMPRLEREIRLPALKESVLAGYLTREPETPVVDNLVVHVYRLQTLLGTPVSDQRGRYLYWWVPQ